MAKAPPSFDFYFNDWIGGVQDLSPEDERHYLRLLIYQWQNGHIPKSKIAQMNVCGVTDVGNWDAIFARIRHKFTPIDDPNDDSGTVFVQLRMKKDREKAVLKWLKNREISEKRRVAGASGGRPKSKTKAIAKANRKAKQKQIKANLEGGRGKGEGGSSKKTVVIPDPLDTEAFRAAWSKWKSVHGNYKEVGERNALSRLAKWGEKRSIAAIEYSIAQDFKGIYEERDGSQRPATPNSQKYDETRKDIGDGF